jgi:hypothetical protein
MIEGIVKKIMMTGLTKYAKKYEVSTEQVQIKVTDNPMGTVFYDICVGFETKERVTFLNIMDKKLDLLQYEAISNPFMKSSLNKYATETEDDVENVCSFILKHNDNIGLSFYNKFKNGKNVLLGKHLSELGL